MSKDNNDKADDVEDVKGDEDVVKSSESINSNQPTSDQIELHFKFKIFNFIGLLWFSLLWKVYDGVVAKKIKVRTQWFQMKK